MRKLRLFWYRIRKTYRYYKSLKNEAPVTNDERDILKEEFIELVCELSKFDRESFEANIKKRKREYVYARFVLMVIYHYSLGYSQLQSEKMVGKAHPGVSYARTQVNNFIKTDKLFREQYKKAFLKAYMNSPAFANFIDLSKLL